jgi:hypothetical protein
MAIYESAFLSSIKGSVGGITFYTGQNGRIMRVRKQNINVNSLAQKQSRNLLVNSNAGYHNLSAFDKSTWTTWANSNFYSLRNPETINKSGYVAYRSIQNVINTMNSKFLTPVCSGLSAVTLLAKTEAPFAFTSIPSGLHVLPNIIDAPGSNYPIVGLNFSLTSLNILQFDLQFGILPHVLITSGQLQDSNSLRYGLEAFISNPGSSINFRPKSFFMKVIMTTKNLTFSVPGLTGYSGVRYNVDCSSNLLDSKYNILPGKYYYVTVVACGTNGTQVVLSTKCVLTT